MALNKPREIKELTEDEIIDIERRLKFDVQVKKSQVSSLLKAYLDLKFRMDGLEK
jgi:hypothetical protein